MENILVTGAGGIGGVNFVRAIRTSETKYKIVGTDFNKYYIHFPDVDRRYDTPRHDDPSFLGKIREIVKKEKIDFVHPHPSSEALVISKEREKIEAEIYLPDYRTMITGQDKLATQRLLEENNVNVARTEAIISLDDIKSSFQRIGEKVWVRARHGAGGRLSLLCENWREAELWIRLWVSKGVEPEEMIMQEYLPGRNIAWDSIWFNGNLITSYSRERLEYPLKHVSPSGITGTPSVSRTVEIEEANLIGEKAVRTISKRPHGVFSVDMKENESGKLCITEVDPGKFHTTMPLWGYVAFKYLGMPWYANLADLYVRIGISKDVPNDIPKYDLIPGGYYMVRNIDSGILIMKEDGWKVRIA